VNQEICKAIVGLGNPGPEYQCTRHNIGAHVVRFWAEEHQLKFRSERGVEAAVARGVVGGVRVLVAVPQTYMNESGRSVSRVLRLIGAAPEDLLVVADDIETPLGGVKSVFAGGTRGHNGLKSLNGVLGSMNFTQVRFGVGRPGNGSVADYVLHRFSEEEMNQLPSLIEEAKRQIDEWLGQGGLPLRRNL
jgi:PTH1 family peptidyl-tRNA hydrolase